MPMVILDTPIEAPPPALAHGPAVIQAAPNTHPLERVIDRATTGEAFTWVLVAGTFITVVAISKISSTIKAVSRERTRREIAAYIAEGTMSPEQGERLMRAGRSEQQSC